MFVGDHDHLTLLGSNANVGLPDEIKEAILKNYMTGTKTTKFFLIQICANLLIILKFGADVSDTDGDVLTKDNVINYNQRMEMREWTTFDEYKQFTLGLWRLEASFFNDEWT